MADETTQDELLAKGKSLLRAGKYEKAQVVFLQAIDIDELSPDAHDGVATALYMQGELDLAAEHFERVTRLDPRRGSAWINLGAVYNRLTNYSKAAEVLRRAVQVERTSSAAFYNLGSAYRHLKQWAMAVPAYREAIRLEPDQPDSYVNLGQVYLEMKNIPQATLQFKKALDLRPESKRARKGLDECEAVMNSLESKASPFGRLVDKEMLKQGQDADVVSQKRLSEEERMKDRSTLEHICAQLDVQGLSLVELIDGPLHNAVTMLAKGITLTDRRERDAALTEASELIAEVRKEFAPRVNRIRVTMKTVRDHEETMR